MNIHVRAISYEYLIQRTIYSLEHLSITISGKKLKFNSEIMQTTNRNNLKAKLIKLKKKSFNYIPHLDLNLKIMNLN